jgi:hypothetical protein
MKTLSRLLRDRRKKKPLADPPKDELRVKTIRAEPSSPFVSREEAFRKCPMMGDVEVFVADCRWCKKLQRGECTASSEIVW